MTLARSIWRRASIADAPRAKLLIRLAAVPLNIDMVVAIATTKLPMLIRPGFWTMAHESRTDLAMLLGACCLAWIGAGPLSFDGWIARRRKT